MCPSHLTWKVVALLLTDSCLMIRTMTKERWLIPFMKTINPSFAYAVDTLYTEQGNACLANRIAPSSLFPMIGNMTNSFPNPTKSSVSCSTSRDHVLMPSPVMEVISVPYAVTAATLCATVLETKSESIL